MNFEDFEEKTIKRKEIFKGHVVHVVEDDVELPNNLGIAKRELVFHSGGAVIIPFTSDEKIVLVEQFRKPLEKVILEVPAGKLEIEEENTPEDTAKRELEEETGYRAKTLYKLTQSYPSPGFCSELLYFYVAKDLVKVENPLPKDEGEIIVTHELTFEETKQAEREGLICDSKTQLALWFWEIEKLRGKLNEQ